MAEGQAPEPEANPSRDVFISYASQDAAVASKLVETLERHGLRCWIAPRDVKAGAQYADAIVRALTGAKAFVLVLSEHAIASAHVGREIERAAAKKRPILAWRIDAAPLTPALEYFLGESQWIEARSGKTAAACARLIEAIRDPERSAHADAAFATSTAARPPSRSNRMLLGAGLAIVAAALAVFFASRFWPLRHSAAEHPSTVAPAAAVPVSDKSIAVLPFADMSEKHDQEYFADGMAEEVLDLLARIPGLTVVGRTSSFQFKGKNQDLRTIGTQLNAAHVLEGSVRNAGNRVRITAQLINTLTGAHEWSDTYDRQIGDVLALQDAIAAAVVRELQLTVASGFLRSRSVVSNADAYDLMLRGRHASDRLDKEGLDEAVALFQRALELDPTSADAAAALAWAYDAQGEWGFVAPATAFEQARRTAMEALRVDPTGALTHLVLGRVHLAYDWDWAAAGREFKQVKALAPGKGDAIDSEALLSMALGHWDESLRQVKAALAQDPLDPPSFYVLTEVQMRRGHLAEAEVAMRRALDIRPTMAGGHYLLGLVLLARGATDVALVEMQREETNTANSGGLAIVYNAVGRKTESDAALAQMLKEHADDNAFTIAEVYAFRGQKVEAIHWLERAYAQKDPALYFVKVEMPQEFVADPRFKAFLRKMNLPE